MGISGYFALLSGGVETAAVREVSSAVAIQDADRLREVVATTRVVLFVAATGAGLIILCLLPFVAEIVSIPPHMVGSARLALALAALAVTAGMLGKIPQTVLFGSGRNDKSTIVATVLAVASQGAEIVAVFLGAGYLTLFVASAVQAVIGYLLLVRVLNRSRVLPRGRGRPTRSMLRTLLRQAGRNVAVGISGTVSYGLDSMVVGLILPVARVAPYALGLSTANLVRSLSTTGTNLLTPVYAHSDTLGDHERQYRLWSGAVAASLTLSLPMAIALVVFGRPLLHLWVGQVPPDTYAAVIALNVVFLLQLPGHQCFVLLTGIGRNATLARISIPASLANLGFSVAATFWLGPIGPAIGSLPQVILLDFAVLPVMCCRYLGVPARRYWAETLRALVVPLVCALTAAAAFALGLSDDSVGFAPLECVLVCLFAWSMSALELCRRNPQVRALAVDLWDQRLRRAA